MIHGYARVSTTDQDLSIQLEALHRAGADRVYQERRSGKSRNGRPELAALLASLRRGDVLVVTRLDRLARSLADLIDIGRQIEARGAALKVLQQPIDTSTPTGRLFYAIIGAIAQFETELRGERQAEGIARAKKLGVYKGRAPVINRDKVRQLRASGMVPTAIAKKLSIGRASVYRALNAE